MNNSFVTPSYINIAIVRMARSFQQSGALMLYFFSTQRFFECCKSVLNQKYRCFQNFGFFGSCFCLCRLQWKAREKIIIICFAEEARTEGQQSRSFNVSTVPTAYIKSVESFFLFISRSAKAAYSKPIARSSWLRSAPQRPYEKPGHWKEMTERDKKDNKLYKHTKTQKIANT